MARPPLPESDAEIIRRLARPNLSVRGRDRSWPLYLGYGALALIAVFVFVSLSKARSQRNKPAPPIAAATTPPPVAPPVITQMIPQPAPTVATPPPVPQPAPTLPTPATGIADPASRLRAPVMIVDLARGDAPAAAVPAGSPLTPPVSPAGTAATGPQTPGAIRASEDQRFAAGVIAQKPETVAASHLASTSAIAPQGTMIPAVLEGALNSSLPGYVRAVVSRDVRGFDGTLVLIPRGTRLIGEYKSGVANGVSRAFVVWSRILTPDGVSVDIGSPAIDELGRGGIKGEANTHFLRRFGSAILLSVLEAGLQAGVNHFSPNTSTVIVSTPQQANNAATVALQRDIDIPTTITVPQGTPIRVFVARDLDFSGALPAQK